MALIDLLYYVSILLITQCVPLGNLLLIPMLGFPLVSSLCISAGRFGLVLYVYHSV